MERKGRSRPPTPHTPPSVLGNTGSKRRLALTCRDLTTIIKLIFKELNYLSETDLRMTFYQQIIHMHGGMIDNLPGHLLHKHIEAFGHNGIQTFSNTLLLLVEFEKLDQICHNSNKLLWETKGGKRRKIIPSQEMPPTLSSDDS